MIFLNIPAETHMQNYKHLNTDGEFFCHVKPETKIYLAGAKMTGLEFETVKMLNNSKQVEYFGIKEKLNELFLFLKKIDMVILVGYNCKSFDILLF